MTRTSRVVTGVSLGMFIGLLFCLPWGAAIDAALWVPRSVPALRPDRWGLLRSSLRAAVDFLVPFMLGGAVAGGWIGAQLPRMRRAPGAFRVASTAIAVSLLSGRLAYAGVDFVDRDFLLFTAALSLGGGLPVGLLIRDVAFYQDTGAGSGRRRTGWVARSVLYLANRFPRLGAGWRGRRRARIRAQPFPTAWLELLRSRLPIYSRLPLTDQEELQRQVMVFLSEKHIEGVGIEVTDSMRVTIAAHACLLTLRLDADCYAKLRTILVYPRTFVPKHTWWSTLTRPKRTATLGESWQAGVVVLSWKGVRRSAIDFTDGKNLVLHEFAHQLDQEDGSADGVPLLDPPLDYRTWTDVLQREFKRLEVEAGAGLDTVLDPYGTTNPAEFFAVATEAFFETPRVLRERHPELYEQLTQYYRQDPATYHVEEAV